MHLKTSFLNLFPAPVRCRTGVGAVVPFGALAVNRQRSFSPLSSPSFLARDFSGPF